MPKEKVIAYFIRAKRAPANPEGDGPRVQREALLEDRKLLVGVGDKCVAPAKSKPKRRKAVKPSAGTFEEMALSDVAPKTEGLGNEAIVWSDEVYAVRHLVKQFEGRFPLIVKVDQGHYREGVVDLSRGQVLLATGCGRQKRVLTKNTSGSLISFPLDYQMEVRLSPTEELMALSTAVTESQLPLTATVDSVSPFADTTHGNVTAEELTFIAVKDTVFLRANAINLGWADQSDVIVIPDLLHVEFRVAQGLFGGTEQEWSDYQGMFSRGVRHLDFDLVLGFQGILLEGPDGNELRSSTFQLAPESSSAGEQDAQTESLDRVRRRRFAYENITVEVDEPPADGEAINTPDEQNGSSSPRDLSLSPPHQGAEPVYGNIAGGRVSCLGRQPSDVAMIRCSVGTLDYKRPQGDEESERNRRRRSSLCEDDLVRELESPDDEPVEPIAIENPYDVINGPTNRLLPEMTSHAADDASLTYVYFEDVITKNEEISDSERVVSKDMYSTHSIEVSLRVDKHSDQDDEEIKRDSVGSDNSSALSHTKTTVPHPDGSTVATPSLRTGPISVLELVNKFKAASQVQDNFDAKRRSNYRLSSDKSKTSDEATDDAKISQKPPLFRDSVTASDVSRIKNDARRSADLKAENRCSSKPESNPPKDLGASRKSKIIPPSLIMPTSTNQNGIIGRAMFPPSSPISPNHVTRDVDIRSSADVPNDLECLSVASVIQCLELLDLSKHGQEFSRNDVDGRRLTDLTEKNLEQQFRFTPLEASKLVRFIRGWRP